jgi:hypothetical protein
VRIFASHEWWKLVPDQSVFVSGAGSDKSLSAAARSVDGDLVIAYLASPEPVMIDLRAITAAPNVRATLINPETRTETFIGEFSHDSTKKFALPRGSQDAVLILQAKWSVMPGRRHTLLPQPRANGGELNSRESELFSVWMKHPLIRWTKLSASSLLAAWTGVAFSSGAVNVTQHHNHDSRDGLYIDPAFTAT